ncbi:hypothetical protein FRB98_001092, partial [Tulasnella sp. 332]
MPFVRVLGDKAIGETGNGTLEALASVCHHWKSIVSRVPELWSSLDIPLVKEKVLNVARYERQLVRAGASPIYIAMKVVGISYMSTFNSRLEVDLNLLYALVKADKWCGLA